MTSCLSISDFQGYLEDQRTGAPVEGHLAGCGKCRAAFDRIAATHKRVNTWLAALASPMENNPVDAMGALAMVMNRQADHVEGLLAPDLSDVPWYQSLYRNVRALVRPEKLPPLNVTSRPVAVKDIWGLYDKDPKSRYISIAVHACVFALLMLGATNKTVQQTIRNRFDLVDPNLTPWVPEKAKGGGGGGARQPLPVSKGAPPRSKQFITPPMLVEAQPRLTMEPSVDAPVVQNPASLGDPLGRLVNGSNGPGFGGGMGSGSGGSIGSGKGGGLGPGEGGGVGGGVFRVGGGVSAPVVVFKADPEYSEEARKAKYSGAVVLAIVVDTEGRARDIHVVKSLGMGLDEKAIEAVQKWKFKPGMRNGQAVNVRATIEVNFRLL